ncbi:MAG: hypothetical protein AB1714_07270 [Acidobacteriota bacterium]
MMFPARRLLGITSAILWMAFPTPARGESWARVIGDHRADAAYAMTTADNGDFVLAGSTEIKSARSADVFLVRLKQRGEVKWMKAYGTGSSEWADGVVPSAVGGFYVAGGYWRGDYHDIICLSLSGTGRVRWQRRFGGDGDDQLHGAAPTSDGGCLLVGDTDSFGAGEYDAWCLKLSSSGAVEWQEAIGTPGWDSAYSVIQTDDGGYLVAGTHSTGLWVLRLGPSGNILWERTYGASGRGAAIRQAPDGDLLVLSNTLMRLDSGGNVLWAKWLRHPVHSSTWGYALEITPDGGVAACGQYPASMDLPDVGWYCKFDRTGAIEFKGASGRSLDAVALASDGGCVFAGQSATADYHGDLSAARLEPDGQYAGGCKHIVATQLCVEDRVVTATPVTSIVTPTTVQGVATKLRVSIPEPRIKDICPPR